MHAVRRSFASHAIADSDVVIASVARTPIGSFQGALSSFSAPELGALAIRTAIERAGISKSDVEEVFMGNVVSAGSGQAPSRQAALKAELPMGVITTDINKVCASGMKAIMLAAQNIMTGHARCMVAGGMESMSNIPYYLPKARGGYRLGNGEIQDGILRDGLMDAFEKEPTHMGIFAEMCAKKYGVTRGEQDAFAAESYRRAQAAAAAGSFANEIFTVTTAKGVAVSVDEEPKNVDFDKMAKLKPAFDRSSAGTVTAANSSKINDGAAALVLMSGAKAKAGGYRPLARIRTFADFAHEPSWFTTTPQFVIQKLLKQAKMELKDIDYFEINEAFAVVALVNMKQIGISADRLNVFGGGVALGHPIGCSGARIVGTLTNVLQQKDGHLGIAAICNGGGGGSAVLIERLHSS